MEAIKTSRTADVWIEESSRPYSLSVSELIEADNARRFTVNVDAVERCVAKLMMAIDLESPDTVLTASTILFIMVVRNFQLKLASVLQFAENFLRGGDLKPICASLQIMLRDDYDKHVTRYETIKLSKPVNVAEVMSRREKHIDIKTLKS